MKAKFKKGYSAAAAAAAKRKEYNARYRKKKIAAGFKLKCKWTK
jgi:hypothetical protein